MRSKIIICFVLMASGFSFAYSQSVKRKEHLEQLWFGYFNQTRFSNKWGMWVDVHLRTKEDFTNNLAQSIVRLGLMHYINDVTKLTAGYAYINHFPADNHKDISQPEHRPWQQIQWHTKHGKKRMMQWIRLEERFRRKILNDSTLAEGYNFNYRVRYNLWYEIPLSKKGIVPNALSFILNDEVHINFGKQIINNYFDQNRFSIGLKFQTSAHDNLQVGYMNLFQQLSAANTYRNINSIRFFYFHNLDLRGKSNLPLKRTVKL
jgi:hypothetical protein